MRSSIWKLLGGAGLAGVVVLLLAGQSSRVAGQPTSSDQPAGAGPATTAPIDDPEPGQPYGLGPNAIPYEAQPEAEQDNLDRMYDRLEANQPAASHEAFARAADQAVIEAQAMIASRHVGLEGVENQGVVP
jgi:hypothetical protein